MKPVATGTDLGSHEFRVLGALFTGRSGHSFLRTNRFNRRVRAAKDLLDSSHAWELVPAPLRVSEKRHRKAYLSRTSNSKGATVYAATNYSQVARRASIYPFCYLQPGRTQSGTDGLWLRHFWGTGRAAV